MSTSDKLGSGLCWVLYLGGIYIVAAPVFKAVVTLLVGVCTVGLLFWLCWADKRWWVKKRPKTGG